MPSRRSVRITRNAISPRFATSTEANIRRSNPRATSPVPSYGSGFPLVTGANASAGAGAGAFRSALLKLFRLGPERPAFDLPGGVLRQLREGQDALRQFEG